MTLIAAFASSNFAIMVADRRRSQIETGIKIDDVRKIISVNDNVMVGFAGIYHCIGNGRYQGVAETIINENLHLTSNATLEGVAAIYSEYLLSKINAGVPKERLEVTFHLAGLNEDGTFALGRVSCFEEFEPLITVPPDTGITWGMSRAVHDPVPWLEARIAELKFITPESVQDLATRLVEYTAEKDGYVSGTYDMLTLSKS